MSTAAEPGGLFRDCFLFILSLPWLCDTVQGTELKREKDSSLLNWEVVGPGNVLQIQDLDLRPWPHRGGASGTLLSLALPPLLVHVERCCQAVGGAAGLKAGKQQALPQCPPPSAGPSVEAVPVPCTGLWRHCSTGMCRSRAALDGWSPGARPRQGRPSPPAESLISPCSRQCRFPLAGELNSTPHEPWVPATLALAPWGLVRYPLTVCSGYQWDQK